MLRTVGGEEGDMRVEILFGLALAVMAGPVLADQTGLAEMHALRREGGRTCMSDHFHSGSSSGQRSRAAAETAAIRSWADFTALDTVRIGRDTKGPHAARWDANTLPMDGAVI